MEATSVSVKNSFQTLEDLMYEENNTEISESSKGM